LLPGWDRQEIDDCPYIRILLIEIVLSSNGHSHLQATLLGPSVAVPISDGNLVLGNWQQIFHLECDTRGRERTIMVTVIGNGETIQTQVE
jgi:hypothetical protein